MRDLGEAPPVIADHAHFKEALSASGAVQVIIADAAALNGKLQKAKSLIKANPNLVFSQASYASQTPLHLAAEYGHKDVADWLRQHGGQE